MNAEKETLHKLHKPALAIPLVIMACLCNAGMASTAKFILLKYHTSNAELVFFRFFISLLLLVPFLVLHPKYRPLKQTLKIHVWPVYLVRLISGMISVYAYFYALHYISLSDAVLLNYTSPLFIPLVFWIWKGVGIQKRLWPGLILGFIGVAVTVKAEFTNLHLMYIIGLLAGVTAAISYCAVRLQNFTETPIRINFYFFLGGTLVSFMMGASSILGNIKTISAHLWMLLILLGVFGVLFQGFIILALKWAQARYIGAFLYFTVVFAMVFEKMLFNSDIGFNSMFGFIFILIGAILMAIFDPAKQNINPTN